MLKLKFSKYTLDHSQLPKSCKYIICLSLINVWNIMLYSYVSTITLLYKVIQGTVLPYIINWLWWRTLYNIILRWEHIVMLPLKIMYESFAHLELGKLVHNLLSEYLYRCTVHFGVYLSNTPTHAHTHTHTHTHIYIYICVCVCVCVFFFLFPLLHRACCRFTQLLHQPLHMYRIYNIYTLKH